MTDDTEADALAGGLIATALLDTLLVRGHISHAEANAALKRAYDSLNGRSNPTAISARRAIGRLMDGRYAVREESKAWFER